MAILPLRIIRAALAGSTALVSVGFAVAALSSATPAYADGGAGGTSDTSATRAPGGTYGNPGSPGAGSTTTSFDGAGGGGGGVGAAGGAGGAGGSGGVAVPGGAGGTAGGAGAAGGAGGTGLNSGVANYGAGGGGGGGGGTALTTSVTSVPGANLSGGAGGVGGSSVTGGGGGGGAGGYGVVITNTSNLSVATGITVQGGAGGAGGAAETAGFATPGQGGGDGGDGGVGVSGGGTITNAGSILGGQGGLGGTAPATGTPGTSGVGGAGIVGANLTVINSGTISGGFDATLTTRANAISYTSGTNFLTLSSGGTTGTINGDIAVTGSLQISPGVAAGSAVTLANVIKDNTGGAGSVIKAGTGGLILTAANTYTGGTTINAGSLRLGHVTGGTIDAAGTGTITINTGTELLTTVSGTLANAVTFGTGTETLAAAAGTTLNFNPAFLSINNGSNAHFGDATNTGTIVVTPTLGLAGNTSATLSVDFGTVRDGGSFGFFLQNTNQTSVNNSATLDLNGHSDTINNLQGVSTTATVATGGTAATVLTIDQGSFAGVVSGPGGLTKATAGALTLLGTNTYTGATTISGGTLLLSGAGSIATSSGVADTAAFDISGVTTPTADATFAGQNGTSIATLSGAGTVNLGANRLTITAGSTTFSGVIGPTAGGVTLAAGTEILTGANTYTGQTHVAGGTLQLGNATTTGSITSNVLIESGAFLTFDRSNPYTFANVISGAGHVNQIGAGNLSLTGVNTYGGGTSLAAGTLTLGTNTAAGTGTIAMANATTLAAGVSGLVVANAVTLAGSEQIDAGAGVFTLSGTIGGPGTLNSIGVGNLVLNGANTYGGGTTVANAGTLTLGTNTAASTGTIALATGTTLAAGVTGLVVGNALALTGTDQINAGAGVFTLTGTIAGPGTLASIGAGNLVLNGLNAYSGGTAVNAGTLTLGTNTAAGVGPIALATGTTLAAGVSGLVVGNAVTLTGTDQVNASAGVFTLGGTISGTGTLAAIGTGNLVLNGANAYGGGTTVGAPGTLTLGTNTAAGTGTIALAAGTTLAAGVTGLVVGNAVTLTGTDQVNAGPGVFTLAGTIGGPGGLNAVGAGTLVLTGTDTYAGGTTITAGTLQLGNGGAAGSIAGNVLDNATLAFDRSDTVDFANVVSGPGTINQIGTGRTNLTYSNTAGSNFTGTINVNAGTLAIGTAASNSVIGDVTANAATLNVNAGGTLLGFGVFDGSVNVNGGTVSAGGSPGTLTVAGNYTLNPASTSLFELGTTGVVGGPTNDLIVVGGNLTLAGTLVLQNDTANPLATGDYALFTYNTLTPLATSNFSSINDGDSANTIVYNNAAAKQIDVVFVNGNQLVQYWDGADQVGNGTVNGGAGTWNATNTNWTYQPGAQINDIWRSHVGIFAGAVGGAVTVVGAQNVQGLQFSTNGYALSGGSINAIGDVATPTLSFFTVDAGITTRIDSIITSNTPAIGIRKLGAGALTLGGFDTYGGVTDVEAGTLELLAGGAIANSSGLTNAAAFKVDAGATATFGAGAGLITNAATGTITNGGTVNGVVASNANAITNFGTFNGGVQSNTGTITNSAGTWTGVVTSNAGTITNAATWAGNVLANAGTIGNTGTWTGAVLSNVGTINNGGTWTTTAGGFVTSGTVNTSGALNANVGGLTNTGTVNATGGAVNGTINNNPNGAFNVSNAVTSDGIFNNASNATLTVAAAANYQIAGALNNAGTVNFAGTLAAATFTNTGTVNGTGGAANGPIANSGAFTITGPVTSNSTFTNTAQGILTVVAPGTYVIAGGLANAGTVTNGGGVTSTVSNTGTINNNAAGTWNGAVTSNTGTINNTGVWTTTAAGFNTSGVLNTAGTLNAAAGGLNNTGTVNASGGAVNGTINNNANGIFNVTNTVTSNGLFNNAVGAALNVATGANYAIGSTLTNAGTTTVSGTGVLAAGVLDNTGLNNTGLVNALGGQINGHITNSGTFAVTGAVTSDSTFGNVAGGVLSVAAGANYTLAQLLTNAGAIIVNGQLTDNAGITNLATGTILNDGTVSDVLTNAGLVTNNGIYNADASNTGTINNNGTWNGALTNLAGGQAANNAGAIWNGALDNQSGGVVRNDGTWNGAVTNEGGGSITGSGAFTAAFNNAAGATLLPTGSPTTIGGPLTNAGTIDFRPTNSTNPSVVGSSYTGVAGSQAFANVDLRTNAGVGASPTGGQANHLTFDTTSGTTLLTFRNLDPNTGDITFYPTVSVVTAKNNVDTTFVADPASLAALKNGFVSYSYANGTLFGAINAGQATAAAGQVSQLITTLNSDFFQDWQPFITAPQDPDPNSISGGPWIRGKYGNDTTEATARSSTGSSLSRIDSSYAGFQAGADVGLFNIDKTGWNVIGGVTAGEVFADGQEKVAGAIRGHFEVPFVGVYGAVTNGPFHADALYRHDFYGLNLNDPADNLSHKRLSAAGDSINLDAGYQVALGQYKDIGNFFIEPNTSLILSKVTVDNLTFGGNLGQLKIADIDSALGRFGFRFGMSTVVQDKLALQPFVSANVWHEFAGNINSDLRTGNFDVPLSVTRIGTFAQFGVGLNGEILGANLLGTVRADFRTGDKIDGQSVTAQLRYQF